LSNQVINTNALFTADVHLKPNNAETKKLFISFLDYFRTRVRTLYILGDLFDCWKGNMDDDLSCYDGIFSACARFTETAKLVIIHGNRDYFLGDKFPRKIPAEIHWAPITVAAGGLKIYACHGHRLGNPDRGFKFLHHVFHNRFIVWLNNLMLKETRTAYCHGLMGHSKRRRERVNMTFMKISNTKLTNIFSAGVDLVIGGHFHKSKIKNYTLETGSGKKKKQVRMLGCWENTAPYILIDGNGNITQTEFKAKSAPEGEG